MEVTPSLHVWLVSEFRRRRLTYKKLAETSNTNYQNFQKLLQGITSNMRPAMVQAVCDGFNITYNELVAIASGKTDASIVPACYDVNCEQALALWRWVAYDATRINVLKGLSFEGALPEPVHGAPDGYVPGNGGSSTSKEVG